MILRFEAQSIADWCRELYQLKAPQLLLYGRALGLSHAESEDVLQDTFVALLKLEAKPENEIGYCLRAFRNRALTHRRGLLRRLKRELEARNWFETDPDRTAGEAGAMRCLQRLPVNQREAVVLKIWHQLTFEQIGQLQSVSPNTAAGRYRYAMEKLRACLNEINRHETHEFHRGPDATLDSAPAVAGA